MEHCGRGRAISNNNVLSKTKKSLLDATARILYSDGTNKFHMVISTIVVLFSKYRVLNQLSLFHASFIHFIVIGDSELNGSPHWLYFLPLGNIQQFGGSL